VTFVRAEGNAPGVREMLELLRAFRNGTASRAEILGWTRAKWQGGQGGPFPGNGPAHIVFDSIWNIEQLIADEHVVRASDVDSYIRWLEEGIIERFVPFTTLKLDMSSLEARVGIRASRAWIDGLGWKESLRFGSPFTGRGFLALGALRQLEPEALASIDAPQGHPLTDCLEDVVETLALDRDDLEYVEDEAILSALRRWELWRQDDNGSRHLIRTFSGRSKAAALAAEFEKQGHKQLYWVQEATQTDA